MGPNPPEPRFLKIQNAPVPAGQDGGGEQWHLTVPVTTISAGFGSRRLPPAVSQPANPGVLPSASSLSRQTFARRVCVRPPLRAVRFLLSLVFAVLALSFWAMGKLSPRLARTEVSFAAPGGEGWVGQNASASTASKSRRRMILYQPSAAMSNCRMEFTWPADKAGVGLVRSSDSRNYRAVRLGSNQSEITEERFDVMNGIEGHHLRKTIAGRTSDPELRVTFEITGSNAALYLQGELVDVWQDQQLSRGRIGFLEDRPERTAARTIHVSFDDTSRSWTARLPRNVIDAAGRWWASFR